jgi:hypothetical protein
MLVAAYSFDESGDTVLDMSGQNNNFSLGADASRVAGHTGGGIQPATSNATQLPDIGQTEERTVCMWIKGSIPDVWAIQWFDPTADAGAGSGAWGIVFNMGNVCIQGRNLSDTFNRAQAPWPDTTNWHHVAGVYGGSSVKLYLDGVMADQQSLVQPLRSSNAPTLFGGAIAGQYDDLRVYDSALGDSAIIAAMNTPVASADLSSAANLAVDAAFLKRVTAAMQQYGYSLATQIYAARDNTRKAQFNLARNCLSDPDSYGQQFAWVIGADATVDATVDDGTIRLKVQEAWDVVAGAPF